MIDFNNPRRGHHHTFRVREEKRHWALAAAIVAAVTATIGTTMSALAAAQQQKVAVNQNRAQQDLFNQQARAQAMEAESLRLKGAYDEDQFRRRVLAVRSKGIAIGAAQGIDVSYGAPLLNDLDIATKAENEALNIRRTSEYSAAAAEFESGISVFKGIISGQSADFASSQIPLIYAGGAVAAVGAGASAFAKSYRPSIMSNMGYSGGLDMSYYKAGGGQYM